MGICGICAGVRAKWNATTLLHTLTSFEYIHAEGNTLLHLQVLLRGHCSSGGASWAAVGISILDRDRRRNSIGLRCCASGSVSEKAFSGWWLSLTFIDSSKVPSSCSTDPRPLKTDALAAVHPHLLHDITVRGCYPLFRRGQREGYPLPMNSGCGLSESSAKSANIAFSGHVDITMLESEGKDKYATPSIYSK